VVEEVCGDGVRAAGHSPGFFVLLRFSKVTEGSAFLLW
jgi:hypothetical protein